VQAAVWDYYHKHGRDLPWRHPEANGNFDPYKILISEIMLQQTQVGRVISKYQQFISRFPTVQALATASLGEVLQVWSGLGYNRRAQYLHRAAQQIDNQLFPQTMAELVALPGIGFNTAAAILVYAYNQPQPFIETNIRTVYIHHFFKDQTGVSDKQLQPFIEQTMDRERPREWFWALMDYGSHLKATIGNVSQSSRHYAKQSRFEGSRRQIRGEILKQLGNSPRRLEELQQVIPDERLLAVLADLTKEGLVVLDHSQYRLPGKS
jgi:A/G-specific adenine glycosylase